MNARLVPATAFILALMSLVPLAAQPQGPTAPAQAAAPLFSPQQLDQMLAPIALYPDPLLAQILMAATYPVEIVEADRWLQIASNAALKGDQLAAALQQQAWDPSVKALVPFPQILRMMDSNLDWTERLGDAFLAEQAAVMDEVQNLRRKAQAAGALVSTPQQTVGLSDDTITIEPANPELVYLPVYNPNLDYGVWPWPEYPPLYLWPEPWPGFAIGFVVEIPIVLPLWGWNHCDWRRHRIDIDPARFNAIDPHRKPVTAGVWQHDPADRRGVPYRDPATRARFQAASPEAQSSFRGYTVPVAPSAAVAAPQRAARAPAAVAAPPAAMHAPPPAFESFGRGAAVRSEAARGAASRATPPRTISPSSGGLRGGGTRR